MITYKELIYTLKNQYSGGIQSDDNSISDREVLFHLKIVRNELYKQYKQAENFDKEFWAQILGCVPTICVDRSECCDIESYCDIIRTKEKLPDIFDIISVTLIDHWEPVEVTSKVQTAWSRYARFTSKMPRAYYRNGYIYVSNFEILDNINVRAVFNDFDKVKNNCNPCSFDNSDIFSLPFEDHFPIPDDLVPTLLELVKQRMLNLSAQTSPDSKNDSRRRIGN